MIDSLRTAHHDWIFDPVPPSGAIRGGIPVAYVFTPDLEVFVREVIQNAHDQKRTPAPATVDFDLMTLAGVSRGRFLDALRWLDLREHVSAVADSDALNSRQLRTAIDDIDANRELLVLRVSDANTHGLTGEEDANGSNYKALVRNVLDTSEERSQRGGSHGLGKAVLWSFSQLGTVLFSSVIEGEAGNHFRFVGRTDLSHHWTGERQWDGPGWLGARDPERPRAISMWDDHAMPVAVDLGLGRSNTTTGTSILIVGFHEPREEEPRETGVIAQSIARFATKNFWPAITNGSLEVNVRVIRDGSIEEEIRAVPDGSIAPFVAAARAEDPRGIPARAEEPGQIAEGIISITVPSRIGGLDHADTPPKQSLGRLRVVRTADGETGPLHNRIALVRGAGMVVEYWHPPRLPVSGGGFHGVFEAGLALEGVEGFSDRNIEDLELFLRACEPPAHDRWDPQTPRVKSQYKAGSVARLRELYSDLTTTVIAMCEQRPPDEADGPERLRKLFRVGGSGAPPKPRFRVTYDHGTSRFVHDSGEWELAGSVHRLGGNGDRPWVAEIAVQLEGDTGLGTHLEIVNVEVPTGTDSRVAAEDGHWRIHVDAVADDTSFVVRAREPVDKSLGRRSRVRLKVSSREESR